MTQLDVRPTGDQEIAGSTPAGSATFFYKMDKEVLSMVIFSLPLIQEGHLSASGKRMSTILVNHIED